MDVKEFANEFLTALAEIEYFESVSLQTEGPVVSGYTYLKDDVFLRFYFNEVTGTMAFALIEKNQRIWGIDFDNRHNWHLHPVDNPKKHVNIHPITIPKIAELLKKVLITRY
ncbi:MAG: hypothetical protein DRI56_07270 [Chloroflexota bacterium]|nr:MAG: hypothetical protein DRI56_07270 [Chloroflexota bacterium]